MTPLVLGVLLAQAEGLAPWREGVKVSAVCPEEVHSIHSYFVSSPESPDGRRLLFYASKDADGHEGEVRILERSTGATRVLARDIGTEDAHRAACQQWVSGGRRAVFHALRSGRWEVVCVDVDTARERVLARDRLVGWGRPDGDVVPLYGPHWNPGEHRDLELLNVETGTLETALTAEALKRHYGEWVPRRFAERSVSIFFPILSPDLGRVMFKVATPAGGDFRSGKASQREGLFFYDLKGGRFLSMRESWGHPAWHPDSRAVINMGPILIDSDTGKAERVPGFPAFPGSHPSFSPDGKLFTTDATVEPKGSWAVVVGDLATGEHVILHRFDNTKGARSWRRSHPHPAFSLDGRRIYFNVSSDDWTRLHVAERAR